MAMDNSGGPDKSQSPQQRFHLNDLYCRDVSFEAPHLPGILFEANKADVVFEINSSYRLYLDAREDVAEIFEVVLRLTVQATAGDRPAFTAEVQQCGLFEIEGYGDEDKERLLRSKAVETLYPYAREAISNLVCRGGFQRIHLNPVDFEARYLQVLAEYHQAVDGAAKASREGALAPP